MNENQKFSNYDGRRATRVLTFDARYCTSAQADEVLYPHCPRAFREAEYRMQVVLREVRSYGADLLMFQVSCLAPVTPLLTKVWSPPLLPDSQRWGVDPTRTSRLEIELSLKVLSGWV